jgi:hypothetical protein
VVPPCAPRPLRGGPDFVGHRLPPPSCWCWAVGVPASVLAAWTHNQLADTDRFVATVSPVIEDPFVHSALANRITTDSITATAPCARCGTGMPAPAGRAAKRFRGDACRKRQATGRSKVMIRPSTAPGPIRPLTSA